MGLITKAQEVTRRTKLAFAYSGDIQRLVGTLVDNEAAEDGDHIGVRLTYAFRFKAGDAGKLAAFVRALNHNAHVLWCEWEGDTRSEAQNGEVEQTLLAMDADNQVLGRCDLATDHAKAWMHEVMSVPKFK